jgi:O-antigen biosynthesis protein
MSETNPLLVSVIIPCYNQGNYVYEAALSAKLAYRGPVDIIVINDGSTEAGIARKLDVIRDRLSDERCSIRIIHQANKGLSGARNVGIAAARGSFIQLLDSDDLLVAGKIDDQVGHLRAAAEIDVSISDCLFMNEMLDTFEYHDRLVAGFDFCLDDFAYRWERGFSIPIHCALFHRHVFERLRFPDTVKAKEDWIFWVTLVSGGGRLAYMGSRTAVYRVHDQSMCRNMPALGRQWLKAATEIDGIIGDRCPGFMDQAINWYMKVYRDGNQGAPVEAEPTPERKTASASFSSLSMPATATGKPKISAIVPVFGHYDYLFDCISSIALQDVDGLEVVIVEDASPDPRVRDLLATIPKACSAVRVHHNEANAGIAETQNIAVKMARGEYVAFIDCDDKLPPRALARALAFTEENGGCDYFFSDRFDIDTSDNVIRLAQYGGYNDNDRRFTGEFLPDLLNGMIASHLKIVRRSSFERVRGFDAEFSGVQDWELALKIAEFGKFLYLPEPLYLHRIHPRSVTSGDVRGQFYRSNCLRHKFAPRLLKLDDEVRRTFRNSTVVLGDQPIQVLDMAAAWRRGPVVLDASRALTRENLWMVREFNSYIDAIIWSTPDIYPALLGWVWSPNILKRV